MGRQEKFVANFRQIQPKFTRFYSQMMMNQDLTLPQYALLGVLSREGALPMNEAGARLHITKPAVTHLSDKLEKKGLLKREAHPEDRRVTLLKIQKKGLRIVDSIEKKALDFKLRAFNKFTGSEKDAITKFFDLLSVELSRVLKDPEPLK